MITNIKLQIEIDSGDDAIISDPAGEIRHLLTSAGLHVALAVASDDFDEGARPLRDSNGNTVGFARLVVERS